MLRASHRLWRRDLNQMASGRPGAVQTGHPVRQDRRQLSRLHTHRLSPTVGQALRQQILNRARFMSVLSRGRTLVPNAGKSQEQVTGSKAQMLRYILGGCPRNRQQLTAPNALCKGPSARPRERPEKVKSAGHAGTDLIMSFPSCPRSIEAGTADDLEAGSDTADMA